MTSQALPSLHSVSRLCAAQRYAPAQASAVRDNPKAPEAVFGRRVVGVIAPGPIERLAAYLNSPSFDRAVDCALWAAFGAAAALSWAASKGFAP